MWPPSIGGFIVVGLRTYRKLGDTREIVVRKEQVVGQLNELLYKTMKQLGEMLRMRVDSRFSKVQAALFQGGGGVVARNHQSHDQISDSMVSE